MNFSPNVWNQIKNITCGELISALEKDGWIRDIKSGAVLVYYHESLRRRITIHYHPAKTYHSPSLLKDMLAHIGWNENDLRRLKLIR